MNSPSRLLNSAMSLSSMCAHVSASGEVSSSSFCLPSTSLSPMHCFSTLAELSLSSSSLDGASIHCPFSTTTTNHHNIVSSSNTNSLLASPVARSPRLFDSPLMNHDIFISPLRQQQLQTPTSLSEPSHKHGPLPALNCGRYSPVVSRVTACSLSPISSGLLSISPSSSSSSNVTSVRLRASATTPVSSSLSSSLSQSLNTPTSVTRTTTPVAFNISSIATTSNDNATYSSKMPSTSMLLSTMLSATTSKPRPIAPAPTPAYRSLPRARSSRSNSGVVQQPRRSNAKATARTPSSGKTVADKRHHNSSNSRQQPLLISTATAATSQQPTAVQGLLIQVPLTTPAPMNAPVLLTITSPVSNAVHAQPTRIIHAEPQHHDSQPLLVMTSTTGASTSAAVHHQLDTATDFTNSYSNNRSVISVQHVRPQPQQQLQLQQKPSSSAHFFTVAPVTTSRQQQSTKQPAGNPPETASSNLCDGDIPTKSINLENLNCARSLVVFPPTLPAFTTSAKRNLFNGNYMSMPGLSLLASPTGSGVHSLVNSGPPSPSSNLLSLSPNQDVTGLPPNGGHHVAGLTPAQLAAQMRLSDALHLASDTVISGIHVGNLLEAVRKCRERRNRFRIAQQEVANALVPHHGEVFRQASICKLENLSLKLEVASRMVKVLEPYFDAKEEEFNRLTAETAGIPPVQKAGKQFPNRHAKLFRRQSQRHSFSDEAKDILRSVFVTNPYPNKKTLAEIAERLDVPRTVVRVWFANRRIEQNKRRKWLADAGGPTDAAATLPLVLKPASAASVSVVPATSMEPKKKRLMISGQAASTSRLRMPSSNDNSDLLLSLTNSQAAANSGLNMFTG